MPHSSAYYARLIAEVCVLLCDPEIQCDPRGALAGIAMQDLVHCYTAACEREQAAHARVQQELPAPVRALLERAA